MAKSRGISRKPSVSADERRWQAEEDARAWKRYEEMKSNRSRVSAARGVLRKDAKDTQAALNMVNRIMKGK